MITGSGLDVWIYLLTPSFTICLKSQSIIALSLIWPLLQLLTSRGYLLTTTDSILILVLSGVLLLYSYSSCFVIRLLHFLGTDHTAQKRQPCYCCRGVLPRSCLADSLGADHMENTFHCRREFYSRVFIGSLTSNGCPFIVQSVTSGCFYRAVA
jgi:hypothetical protein